MSDNFKLLIISICLFTGCYIFIGNGKKDNGSSIDNNCRHEYQIDYKSIYNDEYQIFCLNKINSLSLNGSYYNINNCRTVTYIGKIWLTALSDNTAAIKSHTRNKTYLLPVFLYSNHILKYIYFYCKILI
ncbi:MAG: hypothetical protein PHF76_02270 [Bacteroidales bacterium]|nr:hypothetical protein [Bacteroidales bacterium]